MKKHSLRCFRRKARILGNLDRLDGKVGRFFDHYGISRDIFYRWNRQSKTNINIVFVDSKPCPQNPKLRTPQPIEDQIIHIQKKPIISVLGGLLGIWTAFTQLKYRLDGPVASSKRTGQVYLLLRQRCALLDHIASSTRSKRRSITFRWRLKFLHSTKAGKKSKYINIRRPMMPPASGRSRYTTVRFKKRHRFYQLWDTEITFENNADES